MKLKGEVYKTVIRPVMIYGTKTWATMQRKETRIEVNNWGCYGGLQCRVTCKDTIRNKHIQGTTRVTQASKRSRTCSNLSSETDIQAMGNRQWTWVGPLVNPHVFRGVIAPQWRRRFCSSSFRMIITYLGCMSVVWTPCQFCRKSTADTVTAEKLAV